MVSSNGYSIEQHIKKNCIVIYLPQTTETLMHTIEMPRERKVRLTDTELATLLQIAIAMYEADTQQTDCLTCRYNSDEWDSPKCDGCSKADSHYEPQTDCAWK